MEINQENSQHRIKYRNRVKQVFVHHLLDWRLPTSTLYLNFWQIKKKKSYY